MGKYDGAAALRQMAEFAHRTRSDSELAPLPEIEDFLSEFIATAKAAGLDAERVSLERYIPVWVGNRRVKIELTGHDLFVTNGKPPRLVPLFWDPVSEKLQGRVDEHGEEGNWHLPRKNALVVLAEAVIAKLGQEE